jgi:hypothetical protein
MMYACFRYMSQDPVACPLARGPHRCSDGGLSVPRDCDAGRECAVIEV